MLCNNVMFGLPWARELHVSVRKPDENISRYISIFLHLYHLHLFFCQPHSAASGLTVSFNSLQGCECLVLKLVLNCISCFMFGWVWFICLFLQVRQCVGTLGWHLWICGEAHQQVCQVSKVTVLSSLLPFFSACLCPYYSSTGSVPTCSPLLHIIVSLHSFLSFFVRLCQKQRH